jgi:hypothetical protein
VRPFDRAQRHSVSSGIGVASQMSLELCECHFDGVEIGAVGRQEQEPSSALLQDRFCFFTFVTGEIVSARTKFVAGMTTSLGVKVGASWV